MNNKFTPAPPRTRGQLIRTLVTVLMFGLLTSQFTATAKVRRIKFKPGATTASVTGRLNGSKDEAHFVIRLLAGQTMNLAVEGKCEDCYAEVGVESPAGAHDSIDTAMCFCMVEVTNTAAGDYRITVAENRKGEKWKGSFVLKVDVH